MSYDRISNIYQTYRQTEITPLSTGLPTKNETSETTAVNLCYLYFIFMIPCNCKLVSFLTKSLYKPLYAIFQAIDLI